MDLLLIRHATWAVRFCHIGSKVLEVEGALKSFPIVDFHPTSLHTFSRLERRYPRYRNSTKTLNMADELKALGNKAIAEKNFDEAM